MIRYEKRSMDRPAERHHDVCPIVVGLYNFSEEIGRSIALLDIFPLITEL